MARRGRPRKPDVERHPCGQPIDEPLPPPFNMESVAEKEVVYDQKIVRLRKRVPQLERLFDEGRIKEHLFMAGEQYITLVREYRQRLIAAPKPTANVSRPEGLGGYEEIDLELLDIEQQKAIQRANESLEDRYDAVWKLLVDRDKGIAIKKAVDKLCLYPDEWRDFMLFDARRGLKLLAKHFGFAERFCA